MVTAMRNILVSLVFSILSQAQTLPFFLNNTSNLISPATGPQSSTVLFGAAVAPDGTVQQGTNLYLFSEANASIRQLTNYAGNSNLTGVTSVAYADSAGFAAFVSLPAGPNSVAEEVHLIDISSGFGVTDPLVAAGVPSPASPLARAHQMPQLQIGGVDAAIKFAGLTPGVVGVYQVNAVVPQGLAAGLQNLTWSGPGGPVDNSSIAVK